jgi:hypothetical protein
VHPAVVEALPTASMVFGIFSEHLQDVKTSLHSNVLVLPFHWIALRQQSSTRIITYRPFFLDILLLIQVPNDSFLRTEIPFSSLTRSAIVKAYTALMDCKSKSAERRLKKDSAKVSFLSSS